MHIPLGTLHLCTCIADLPTHTHLINMMKLVIFSALLATCLAAPAPAPGPAPEPGLIAPIAYTSPIAYTAPTSYSASSGIYRAPLGLAYTAAAPSSYIYSPYASSAYIAPYASPLIVR